MEIRIPRKEENKKVIKFLSKVFHRPFPSLIPSLYGKEKNSMDYHYIVEDGGELVGGICAYPQEVHVNGVVFNGVAIGMVATKKSKRGKGIMSTMLNHVFKEYENICEISYLTGRRHRYEHFGYYPTGVIYSYKISSMSIKKYNNGNPYSIEPAKTKEDYASISELAMGASQYNATPISTEGDTLRNWFSKAYVIRKDGKAVGFAGGKSFGSNVLERLYVKDGSWQDYVACVSAYKEYKKVSNLTVEVLPSEKEFKEAMQRVCEDYSIVSTVKYKVFDYQALIYKLLQVGKNAGSLEDVETVIEIEGRTKLKISVRGEEIAVTPTEEAPKMTLSEQNAIASLVGAEEGIVKGIGKFALRHSDFI